MNSPPDFHITETPTLHFVATGDEQALSQDLQARLDESLRQAGEKPDVLAAVEAHVAASARLQELKKAERALHQYARESGAEMTCVAHNALDGIIVSAAVEAAPDFGELRRADGDRDAEPLYGPRDRAAGGALDSRGADRRTARGFA